MYDNKNEYHSNNQNKKPDFVHNKQINYGRTRSISGAPIVLTQPHMIGADPSYQTVDGLNADSEKHRTFVDIEPVY